MLIKNLRRGCNQTDSDQTQHFVTEWISATLFLEQKRKQFHNSTSSKKVYQIKKTWTRCVHDVKIKVIVKVSKFNFSFKKFQNFIPLHNNIDLFKLCEHELARCSVIKSSLLFSLVKLFSITYSYNDIEKHLVEFNPIPYEGPRRR